MYKSGEKQKMRSKKALINIISSFLLQFVTAICGFIIPRAIIMSFGSNVNGLVSSISQFLGYIVLIEMGVGGVTRAALYKPLAKNNLEKLSGIIKATELFFKKISYIFVGYTILLSISYPFIIKHDFGLLYTSSLIVILGVSTFSQYYFGITYQILLQADQKQYITTFIQIITTVINAILIILLIRSGAKIHTVRLGSALIYVLRPIFLNIYVNNKYQIIKNCEPDNDAIRQRWDGFGHHITYFIHKSTDVVVLTLFTNLEEVSVYSIYHIIVSAITGIVGIFSIGMEAAFGNMISNNEKKSLIRNFRAFDFISSVVTITVFTVAGIMILSFVRIYTYSIIDVNYIRPTFSILIILSEAFFCLRLPYQSVALAAGKYKETRNGAFTEAAVNIILSTILVNYIGIVGVAIGTCVAMAFRTVQYSIFACKKVLDIKTTYIVKRNIINVISILIVILISQYISYGEVDSYKAWAINAVIITLIAFYINVTVNIVFYYSDFKYILSIIRNLMSIKARN